MASVENKREENEENNSNVSNASTESDKSNKTENSWQSPVISSAKSAFDRLLSRGESTEKPPPTTTASKVTVQKSKRKRKYPIKTYFFAAKMTSLLS